MASHRKASTHRFTNARAALTALTAVVAVVATVTVVIGGMFSPSSASAHDRLLKCRKAIVHVTKTIRATATVKVPGPTATVTVSPTGPVPTTSSSAASPSTSPATPTPTTSQTTNGPTPSGQQPLFGAYPGYLSATDHSESYASRLDRVTNEFGGKLGVVRIYQGGDLTLPTMTSPAIVSWDFPLSGTLAGQYDAKIDAIARGATKQLWFVPWHEVDNNKMAPADYVKLFRYIADRVHAIGNPLVKMTPIFMGWSVRNMDLTTFNQFYPGDAWVDAMGFDAYVNPSSPNLSTPEGSLSAPVQVAAQHHKPLVIGEVSIRDGYTDAQWADDVGRIIKILDTPATAAVTWFETNKTVGDYRMGIHTSAVPEWAAVSSR